MQEKKANTIVTDNFNTDLRAEVVAAELINNGISAEQLLILSLGPLKRSFRKDVADIRDELSDYNRKEYTLITTHKEGIYDMLPEGLFHAPAIPKSATTQKDIIDSIKRHRVEEANARRFFLPFESGIHFLAIQMALYESRLDKLLHYDELVNIFKPYWAIFKYLDGEQANVFLRIIPHIHEMKDDYKKTEALFEAIFSMPVTISSERRKPVRAVDPVVSGLGDCILGIDMSTGNMVFDDGEDEIHISIGPMNSSDMNSFMPGNKNAEILEMLVDYFLPVHLDVHKNFLIEEAGKKARLSDGSADRNVTLGVDMFL